MSSFSEDIPVDENITSYDPNEYEEEEAYSAFTLASNTHDYSYENGRRYSSYRSPSHPFPFDDLTVKNEKILHHLMLYLLDNRLCLSPIENPTNILDVRCAQGIWAENAAEKWEQAEIVAMDTIPQPRSTFPNCTFLVQSYNDEWILDKPGMKFDFIFVRNCFATTGDFESLYRQCFGHLIPGGRVEHTEVEIKARCDDGSMQSDSQILRIANLTPEMSSAFGVQYNIAERMKELVEAAGFVDVNETKYKVPLGTWSADPKYKVLGQWFEAFYKSGLQGWIMAVMTRAMGYTPDQVNEMCEAAFREVEERKQHIYFNIFIVTGRRPESET